MEDANVNNQDANRVIVRPTPVGRLTGNFKIDEDVKLTEAYVFVTTNAAVGTDQDGETFWKKLRDSFIQRGGIATRTLASLKNRFNKVLLAEVNKYVGYLHTALHEDQSGWSMIDDTTKAKSDFQLKQGKFFKHDIVYDILSRPLPKYEIKLDTIHPKVARALALLDNDNERALDRNAIRARVAAKFRVAKITALLNSVDSNDDDSNIEAEPVVVTADTAGASNAANSGLRRAVLCDLAMTPRPSIGKKKAKLFAQQAAANKKLKVHLTSPRSHSIDIANTNASLERLASAAEAKNEVGKRMALAIENKNGIAKEQLMMQSEIAKEQLMMQLFLANPQSVAVIAFLAAKSREYSALGVLPVVVTTSNVPVSTDDVVGDEEADFGHLPDTQTIVGCLLDAAAAAATYDDEDILEDDDVEDDDKVDDETYFNARKWLKKNAPPVIDLTMLKGSGFSDDEKENDVAPIPTTVKVKVEAMEEEETQWTALNT